MLTGTVIVWIMVLGVAGVAHWRNPSLHREALVRAKDQAESLMLRVPIALVAAGFLIQLLPREELAARLGETAGLLGIAYGTLIGAALPGGPMVTFPVLVVLLKAGVAGPPAIAVITAWSVLAVHRTLVFELPLLGGRFTAVRILSSLGLPLLAGLAASLLV